MTIYNIGGLLLKTPEKTGKKKSPSTKTKTMKRNRLRQLVQWGYITQPQANEQWRQYLRLFKQTNNQGK